MHLFVTADEVDHSIGVRFEVAWPLGCEVPVIGAVLVQASVVALTCGHVHAEREGEEAREEDGGGKRR